ncbi:MAG: hypothetical protein HC934_11445 [Acaryochloridaceae cyanobacterium SU_2_1]|nr:hypothetical protein [Acaryochloridaceae cyanobacterium SU_2_1]
MLKTKFLLTTTLFTLLLALGGEVARSQSRVVQKNAARPSDAEILGVQEVGLESWRPAPLGLPLPEEIEINVNRKVELAPGPEKPGNLPEYEDHRGIQVKVDNP